jgi:tetratricopeptide (TPR) repeat protein
MFTHGRFKEAEEYAQKALNMAQPFNDTPILAEALLMYGVIAYRQTRYEEGDTHFLAALELLDRLGLYEELRSAYKDYAQLLEQRGKEREAIIQYKRTIEISQKLEKLGR